MKETEHRYVVGDQVSWPIHRYSPANNGRLIGYIEGTVCSSGEHEVNLIPSDWGEAIEVLGQEGTMSYEDVEKLRDREHCLPNVQVHELILTQPAPVGEISLTKHQAELILELFSEENNSVRYRFGEHKLIEAALNSLKDSPKP